MLTNTTESGTAMLPRRRLTLPALTDVSPSAQRPAPSDTPRRPPRFPALARAALACVLALAALATPVLAQTTVPATWSLKPTGLTGGTQFRLLFLSSTKRDGSVTTIANYNTFIQNLAAAGHADIQAYSAGFRVVGCTEAVDARDNTSTTGTGVPIYWLNGAKVADDYADFYDGSWDDEANDKNESGTNGPDTSQSGNYPITGCKQDGTEFVSSISNRSFALGSDEGVVIGRPNSSTASHGPISTVSGNTAVTVLHTATRPMYGLSGVFQVATNRPPDASDSTVTTNEDTAYTFAAANFNFSDPDTADTLASVKIFTLPASGRGTLALSGTAVTAEQVVAAADIGNLMYTPPANTNGTGYASFTFAVDDGMIASPAYTMDINVTPVNDTPSGQPTITGTATVGQTLTADASGISDVDGLPAVSSYSYQWVRVNGSDSDISGATASTYTLQSADGGKKVKVKVRFTDQGGTAETVTSTAYPSGGTGVVPIAPGAPTSLSATASGNTQINLSWTAPGSTGGSAITGYKIESSPNGTANWSDLVANTNNTNTTYAHTGLAAGTTRHYRVSAINTVGTGPASNTANATTGQTVQTTVPGAPTSLSATANGNTRINLSWTAPGSTGGSAITGYKIESSPNGTANWSDLVANTSSSTTTYAHTGLAAGTTRHYRVSAINTNGPAPPRASPTPPRARRARRRRSRSGPPCTRPWRAARRRRWRCS